jgi:hypothetical protein
VFFIVEEPGQLLLAPFGVLCIWVGPAMLFFYNLNQKLIERRKQGFQRVFLTVMWLSIGVSVLSISTIAIGLAYVFLVMSFHS